MSTRVRSECIIIIPMNRAASPPPVQAYVHTLSRKPVRTSVLQAVPVNMLHHRNQLVILQAVVALDELANTRLGDSNRPSTRRSPWSRTVGEGCGIARAIDVNNVDKDHVVEQRVDALQLLSE